MGQFALTYRFEELPLLRVDGVEGGPERTAILASGTAELGFDPDGTWFIERILVDADLMGAPGTAEPIDIPGRVDGTTSFWWLVLCRAIALECTAKIDELVRDEIALGNLDEDAQERLSEGVVRFPRRG